MENASQALLIAGGILIAILTLTMLVYMFGNLSTIGKSQQDQEELESLKAWNAEWEAHNKMILYGSEVFSVINKAENNNNKGETNVNVEVYDENDQLKYSSDGRGNKDFLYNDVQERNRSYTCVKMEYNSTDGRVNYIEFKSL